MTAPMFSIIVPTFNAAETLQSCVESIICQTFKGVELVLVNGGSTDRASRSRRPSPRSLVRAWSFIVDPIKGRTMR